MKPKRVRLPFWVQVKRRKRPTNGSAVRGKGRMWTAEEDQLILASGPRRGVLGWRDVASQMERRTPNAIRKRYTRLQEAAAAAAARGASTSPAADAEAETVEIDLGPAKPDAWTDAKLWPGAAQAGGLPRSSLLFPGHLRPRCPLSLLTLYRRLQEGWRSHEPGRAHRYVYAHAELGRHGSRRAVLALRKSGPATDPSTHRDEAGRITELEGYPLVPSVFQSTSAASYTGYQCVKYRGGHDLLRPFEVVIESKKGNVSKVHLGFHATAAEGALVYAKHLGKEAAAAAAAESRRMARRHAATMTVEEAEAQACAEGLRLVRDASTRSGFKGVSLRARCTRLPYMVRDGRHQTLGTYATLGEAALAFARHLHEDSQEQPPN